MFEPNSLVTRIGVGKGVGFLFGIFAFVFVPGYLPDPSTTLQWGIFLWYVTFGAIIGVFGVYTRIPIINIALPWWIRGAGIGAWLNFVISLLAYDKLELMMDAMFGEGGVITSPFWLILEGIIVGFVVDFFSTKFGGEGADILK